MATAQLWTLIGLLAAAQFTLIIEMRRNFAELRRDIGHLQQEFGELRGESVISVPRSEPSARRCTRGGRRERGG